MLFFCFRRMLKPIPSKLNQCIVSYFSFKVCETRRETEFLFFRIYEDLKKSSIFFQKNYSSIFTSIASLISIPLFLSFSKTKSLFTYFVQSFDQYCLCSTRLSGTISKLKLLIAFLPPNVVAKNEDRLNPIKFLSNSLPSTCLTTGLE